MEAYKVVNERVKTLLDPGEGSSVRSRFSSGGPVEIELWPVNDPQAFADRIAFGTVTRRSGRTITVAAAPGLAAEAAPGPAPRDEVSPFRRVAPGRERATEVRPPAGADRVTRLLFELKASDPGRQKQAVQRLLQVVPVDDRREEVQGVLRPLLDDADGFLVTKVIRTMGSWHTEDTVAALIPLTTDGRANVRWQAIETLGTLQDARAAEAIADRLKDDGIKAEPALRVLGEAAEPALIERLRSPDRDIRRKACDVLRDIGGKETLTFMSKARPDPDLGVRMAAQQAMQAIAQRVGAAR
jgi:hypothetical protein